MDTNWDETVVLDIDHLTEYTAGDKEVLGRALDVFRENAPSYLMLLKDANRENWKTRAHKLKGAARSLGAWRLAKQGERAEFLNQPFENDADRKACLEELEMRLDELMEHLKSVA